MNTIKTIASILAVAALLAPASLAKEKTTTINVIPYPSSVEITKGSFSARGAQFNCDAAMDAPSPPRSAEPNTRVKAK